MIRNDSHEDCAVDDCPRPAKRNGYCYSHSKRGQRGMPVHVPIPQRPTKPFDRAVEAALAYAEADADDEVAYRRARDNLRKCVASCAPAVRAEMESELISRLTREAMAKLRARGVKLGRPHKIAPEEVALAVRRLGGAAKAAAALGLSERQVFRSLRKVRGNETVHR